MYLILRNLWFSLFLTLAEWVKSIWSNELQCAFRYEMVYQSSIRPFILEVLIFSRLLDVRITMQRYNKAQLQERSL